METAGMIRKGGILVFFPSYGTRPFVIHQLW
jgi:hypothetical protein